MKRLYKIEKGQQNFALPLVPLFITLGKDAVIGEVAVAGVKAASKRFGKKSVKLIGKKSGKTAREIVDEIPDVIVL